VRAAALTIAAEVHPLGNLRVQRWLKAEMHADDAAVTAWLHHWMHDGLGALEQFAAQHGGNFLFGDAPGLADLCLVPQMYNARRFALALDLFPRLLAVESRIAETAWAQAAHPDSCIGLP
jgi:maleylacetoacetate isomerase